MTRARKKARNGSAACRYTSHIAKVTSRSQCAANKLRNCWKTARKLRLYDILQHPKNCSGDIIYQFMQNYKHRLLTYPALRVHIRRYLSCIEEAAEFRVMVKQEKSKQVKRLSISHTIPEEKTYWEHMHLQVTIMYWTNIMVIHVIQD